MEDKYYSGIPKGLLKYQRMMDRIAKAYAIPNELISLQNMANQAISNHNIAIDAQQRYITSVKPIIEILENQHRMYLDIYQSLPHDSVFNNKDFISSIDTIKNYEEDLITQLNNESEFDGSQLVPDEIYQATESIKNTIDIAVKDISADTPNEADEPSMKGESIPAITNIYNITYNINNQDGKMTITQFIISLTAILEFILLFINDKGLQTMLINSLKVLYEQFIDIFK